MIPPEKVESHLNKSKSQSSKIDIPNEECVIDNNKAQGSAITDVEVKEEEKEVDIGGSKSQSEANENVEDSSLKRTLCCYCLLFFLGYCVLTLIIILYNTYGEKGKHKLHTANSNKVYFSTVPCHFYMHLLQPGGSQGANNGFMGNNNYLGNSSGIGVDCTTKSYLMGDGTCNDVTNTVRCQFDQGDCCLSRQTKETDLCLDCECKGIGRSSSNLPCGALL